MRTTIISAVAFVLSFVLWRATGLALWSLTLVAAFFGVLVGVIIWAVGASRSRAEQTALLRQIAEQGKRDA